MNILWGMEREIRYSFATHLLESGMDLRDIQELLGCKDSKTREIYIYGSRKDLGPIISPLDRIKEGGRVGQ